MTESMRRSLRMPILVFTIFIIAVLIGYFTFLKPEPSKILKKGVNESNRTKEITRYKVGKFSDPDSWKNVTPPFKVVGNFSAGYGNWSWDLGPGNNVSMMNDWSIQERFLPYPRISINYSSVVTNTIRGESAGNNSKFLILTLDIRNYGYKYFDAHPSKFRIDRGRIKIYPTMNVSTDNMLDVVIPNNSRGRGDLIFLVGERDAYITGRTIEYIPRNNKMSYKILYGEISSIEMNRIEKDEEDVIEENEDDSYVD